MEKEILNFQLSMLIYNVISRFLIFVLIGIPLLILLYVLNIIFVIIVPSKASDGSFYLSVNDSVYK